MKKVSVIVPVFEVEDYIHDCLASIVGQTYRNLEILCVNDETGDNSVTIVRDFQKRDDRIRLLHHSCNKGLGATRNTALRFATGEFLKFVDSDDLLLPRSIESLVAAIERSGANWAFSAFHIVDAKGALQLTRSPFHTATMEEIGAIGWIDFAANPALLNEMWPSAWLPLWRTDKVRKSGAKFREGSYYEDHEFFFTYGFQLGSAVYLPEPLYAYRSDRPGQITMDGSWRIYDVFPVIEALGPIFARNFEGDALLRFSARHAVRLLVERTWILPKAGPAIEAYRRRTAAFLARYPRAVLFECKDPYVSDEDLEALLDGGAEASGSAHANAGGA